MRSRKRTEAITAPILTTNDKATRVRMDISGNRGYRANVIVNPGINNKKRKPKTALKNPTKIPIISIIYKISSVSSKQTIRRAILSGIK
jgi:hypothetical protein